ncbi:MAG: imidazolonepropionase [Gemmatimonadota bacterium]|nr:imidazolonepropionase [Gemmatimonadota bacterium]
MNEGAQSGDLLVTGISQLVDPGDGATSDPLDVLESAWIWITDGRIEARGDGSPPDEALEAPRLDAAGAIALPGLIDPHTHAVFGATREHEFERRLAGATYQEIASGGGGILYSVEDLRERSRDALVALAKSRLRTFVEWGVTTVEVKSGYGLTVEDELKTLRAIRDLSNLPHLPRIVPTFLGAHAIPSEYEDDREGYARLVIDEMLPAVAEEGLAEFCDVFCEEGAFTLAESERILSAGIDLGLTPKIHAEEFTPTGGAALAARLGAASADHLVAIDDEGIEALAASDTVAVLLPGTSFFLRLGRHAPGRALADAGATLALATDFNPGSSMTQNQLLMIAFACCTQGLTIPEAIRAATRGAAKALRRDDRGWLAPGALGDVALFDVPDWRHLAYHYGIHPTRVTIRGGRVIYSRERQRLETPRPVG